jgi:hypothetical protein
MSIATFKKKTMAKYNNVSVGQPTFSLNGTHRNQGYVGQTMLSRSLPRTLMKGSVKRGHGGCCGKYPDLPIVSSGIQYQEDSKVVKSSVLNTSAVLENLHNCIGDCTNLLKDCNGSSKRTNYVKPDSNQNTNSQEYYIKKVANCTISDTKILNLTKPLCKRTVVNGPEFKCAYTRNDPSITKTVKESHNAISSGEYTSYLYNTACSKNDKIAKNPGTHIPIGCQG